MGFTSNASNPMDSQGRNTTGQSNSYQAQQANPLASSYQTQGGRPPDNILSAFMSFMNSYNGQNSGGQSGAQRLPDGRNGYVSGISEGVDSPEQHSLFLSPRLNDGMGLFRGAYGNQIPTSPNPRGYDGGLVSAPGNRYMNNPFITTGSNAASTPNPLGNDAAYWASRGGR